MTTLLSDSEQTVLDAVRRQLLEQRTTLKEQEQETATFSERHAKASAPYHNKLIEQALRSLGIDLQELEKLQQGERNSALKFLGAQQQKALNLARESNERQRTDIAIRSTRFQRFEDPRPPQATDPIVLSLKSATSMDLSGPGGVSIAPEQNVAHTQVERNGWVRALAWDLRGDLAEVDWHFLWTPPRDGLLNVVSLLALNGFAYAYPGPGCDKGSGSWSITTWLTLTQMTDEGQPASDSVRIEIAGDDTDVGDLPFGTGLILKPTRLDGVTTLPYSNRFPAIANRPLTITVSTQLYVLVAHAEAGINFLDEGFQLNVPFVYLFLD